MLTLSDISKAYGARSLFANVSLQVNHGDRLGLVGPNGAGKSTLFAVILGAEPADSGTISLARGTVVGHLPQESAPAGDETVLDLAAGITAELASLTRELRVMEAGADQDSAHYHEVQARFDQQGGYALETKAKKILGGLAFRESDYHRPAREMSGGWVMRAHLARLLVQEPDVLLLDEPTNHLDLDALLWFQEYLRTYPGGILIISHDREFLNQLATAVLEIRQGRLLRYRGNYDAYLEQREAQEEQLQAAFKNQQREIARLQRFIDRFRAKNTKASQAKSKQKQIDRMEVIAGPQGEEATIDFEFPQPKRSGLKAVTLAQVSFAYGNTPVYDRLDFQAERGQRVVLVGSDGAGKSTLLKLLAGVLTPHAGERHLGHNVKEGYYSQYRVEMLNPQRTVLEEALYTPQRLTETFVRTVLGSFLFRGDDAFKRVSVLSGGEKSRLALVKLLLDPPNLLLMDEPTTHLDIPSTEALAAALDQFQGTLIFISHDVYFIRSLANHVVQVKDGRLRHFPGDYQYYLDKTAAEAAYSGAPAPILEQTREAGAVAERRARKRMAAKQRNARYRERQARRQLVQRREEEIASLEARQAALTEALQDPATYGQSERVVDINRELQEIHQRLPAALAEWEEASHRLAGFEPEQD
jgi:ATP-binding cassette, subfamily F, member 3